MSILVDYSFQTLHGTTIAFPITAPGVEGYILGRADDATDYMPDVDLSPANARECGVSRRHAALVQYRSELHLIDLSSVNGTFVNNKRLPPEVAYLVRPGDEIRLGTLELILLRQKD